MTNEEKCFEVDTSNNTYLHLEGHLLSHCGRAHAQVLEVGQAQDLVRQGQLENDKKGWW